MIRPSWVLAAYVRHPSPSRMQSCSSQWTILHWVCCSTLSASCQHVFANHFAAVRSNLVVIVSRIITCYINGLSVLSKSVLQHIQHKYSTGMGKKSEATVLDILMKNEASRSDMIDIMKCMHDYLGKEYPTERRVLSGGDQLTCERQVGAQRHTKWRHHSGSTWPSWASNWFALSCMFPLCKSACNHTNYYTCTCACTR